MTCAGQHDCNIQTWECFTYILTVSLFKFSFLHICLYLCDITIQCNRSTLIHATLYSPTADERHCYVSGPPCIPWAHTVYNCRTGKLNNIHTIISSLHYTTPSSIMTGELCKKLISATRTHTHTSARVPKYIIRTRVHTHADINLKLQGCIW